MVHANGIQPVSLAVILEIRVWGFLPYFSKMHWGTFGSSHTFPRCENIYLTGVSSSLFRNQGAEVSNVQEEAKREKSDLKYGYNLQESFYSFTDFNKSILTINNADVLKDTTAALSSRLWNWNVLIVHGLCQLSRTLSFLGLFVEM